MLEVVCAVIVREERILLCRRAAGRHLAGHWEFPGGKVEDGEDERGALGREIEEELGCLVEVGEALPVVEHEYVERSIRLRPFLCRIAVGEPQSLEHDEIGWFEAEEIEALGLAGADRKVWRGLEFRGGNGR